MLATTALIHLTRHIQIYIHTRPREDRVIMMITMQRKKLKKLNTEENIQIKTKILNQTKYFKKRKGQQLSKVYEEFSGDI